MQSALLSMGIMVDLTGKKFGRWIALSKSSEKSGSSYKWLCKCSCGTKRNVSGVDLRQGKSKSCGCQNKERLASKNMTHNMSSHPGYDTWKSMLRRCSDKKHASYHRYGGRGITVCKRWSETPGAFLKWLEGNSWHKGLQVDRRDNDLGYSPENCEVVTPVINANNRRVDRSGTSRFIGVSFMPGNGQNKWRATIYDNRKTRWCCSFQTEIEAAIARDCIIKRKFKHKGRDKLLVKYGHNK